MIGRTGEDGMGGSWRGCLIFFESKYYSPRWLWTEPFFNVVLTCTVRCLGMDEMDNKVERDAMSSLKSQKRGFPYRVHEIVNLKRRGMKSSGGLRVRPSNERGHSEVTPKIQNSASSRLITVIEKPQLCQAPSSTNVLRTTTYRREGW